MLSSMYLALPLCLGLLISLKGCGDTTTECDTSTLTSCQSCMGSEVWDARSCGCAYRVNNESNRNQTAAEMCSRLGPNADGSTRCDAEDCLNTSLPADLVLRDDEACECAISEVMEGRAFITEKGIRMASLHDGTCKANDWTEKVSLGRRVNPGLASHFKSLGLAEHASVASFARVVMELMQLAAPADLVDRTLAAGQEEVRHAQMALSLARGWSSEDFHLGPLDGLEFAPITLMDLARQTVFEAIEGETPAALAAVVALRFAKDEGVREFLQVVASEERRHAELAWATVAWAIQAGKTSVQQAALEALDVAEAKLMQSVASSEGNLDYGILSSTLDLAVRREAASLVKSLRLELSSDNLWQQELVTFEGHVREAFDKSIIRLSDVNEEVQEVL